MSQIRDNLLYTKDDEWVAVDGDSATIGITDHAQDALSDIVYLELPAEGDAFSEGETFGVVESVKAAADLFMPIDGVVQASNEDLIDEPEKINEDPYGSWMVKITISNDAQLSDLMNAEQYKAYLAARE